MTPGAVIGNGGGAPGDVSAMTLNIIIRRAIGVVYAVGDLTLEVLVILFNAGIQDGDRDGAAPGGTAIPGGTTTAIPGFVGVYVAFFRFGVLCVLVLPLPGALGSFGSLPVCAAV